MGSLSAAAEPQSPVRKKAAKRKAFRHTSGGLLIIQDESNEFGCIFI